MNGKKNPGELGVGELEGAEGAMAPIVRVGEDEGTMRARLVCEFLPFFFSLEEVKVERELGKKWGNRHDGKHKLTCISPQTSPENAVSARRTSSSPPLPMHTCLP